MDAQLKDEMHTAFSDTVRKFAKENDMSHIDLTIVTVSTIQLFVNYFIDKGIDANDFLNEITELNKKVYSNENMQNAMVLGMQITLSLLKEFYAVKAKFPTE